MTPLFLVLIAAGIATYLYGPWRLFKRICARMAALCMAGAYWCGLQEDMKIARRAQYERYLRDSLAEVHER